MEKFKERQEVKLFQVLASILLALSFLFIVTNMFGFVIFCVAAGFILFIISSLIRTDVEYTKKVLNYMHDKVDNCYSQDDFLKLKEEFLELTTKDGKFILPCQNDLLKVLFAINSLIKHCKKIEFLEESTPNP